MSIGARLADVIITEQDVIEVVCWLGPEYSWKSHPILILHITMTHSRFHRINAHTSEHITQTVAARLSHHICEVMSRPTLTVNLSATLGEALGM